MDKRLALDALRRDAEADSPPVSRRQWPWLAAGGLVLAAAAAVVWWFVRPNPVAVQTVPVTVEGGLSGSVLNASGTVVAQVQATVAAQVTGMVTEVYVREGDHVQKGQVVARLDDAAATASASAAAGQLKAAEAEVRVYAALVERYRREVDRRRSLAAAGAVSQSSLEEAEASLEQNRQLVETYRGAVEQYRGTLAYYGTQRAYAEIRAPFAGVVTGSYAHPGEMISPQAVGGFTQTGICTIVDMSSLELTVDVGEAFITRIQRGQRAEVVLDAYPDWRIPARVIAVVPTANQQKATVKVRLGFDRLDARILPQMSAQVWFAASPGGGATDVARRYVPRAALRSDAGGPYVYRIDGDAVRKTAVRVAPGAGPRALVLSGLAEGDRIVTTSETPLSDGMKVREQ